MKRQKNIMQSSNQLIPQKIHQRQAVAAYPMVHGEVRRAPAQSQRRTWDSRWLLFFLIIGTALFVVLPVTLLVAAYAFFMITERIFPGVQVGSVSIGGLNQAEAEQKLDIFWNQQHKLVLSDGKRVWEASPLELGLWVDPQASLENAYQVGRGPDGFQELFWLIRERQWEVEPLVVFNPVTAANHLEEMASLVNIPAHNATLKNENGQWVPVAGQNGLSLNVTKTVKQLSSNPDLVMATGYLPLSTQVVAPRIADAGPLVERLQAALDHPLKIRAYDPITNETIEWSVPKDTFATWLVVDIDGDNINIGVDGSALYAYLQDWEVALAPERALEPYTIPPELSSRWIAGEPVMLLIRHLPTTYTVQVGENLTSIGFKVGMPYWKIQQANPGVNLDQLSAGQVLKIPSKNEMLPLPIVLNKRIVISISDQRMWTYENGTQRSEHIISTGIASSPTYPGVYQIRSHEENAYASVWDLYMPHFMGIYEGWPGFMNGIHGLPLLSSGVRLWGNVLGRPASYGCIILSLQEAEDLYYWAEEGVIVEIRP